MKRGSQGYSLLHLVEGFLRLFRRTIPSVLCWKHTTCGTNLNIVTLEEVEVGLALT